ncbi:hypothetical protein A5893_03925 [Pedobacter psychrophilus]|uniref:Uncharacterized protein n=1 Tax=Pedobacter psychrophilus TaxID=1826909 RepID=A0A179DNZ1_9SPHI|nr:hypothetical protein [Pedobacter psychrophilus]OAQ42269.1 hypothetical protein A5893_03925 [Pedobacter psychrophilus]
MRKLEPYLFLSGILIQFYFLISSIYASNLNLVYEEKQNSFVKFWPFFNDPYHIVFLVFIITIGLVSLIIYNIATSNNTLLKKAFLIVESIFMAWVGFSLL